MTIETIRIPDFGKVQKITVIEVFIAPGDEVVKEGSLLTLESEKAVMDLPSPVAGIIKEVFLKPDDVVQSGDAIALIITTETGVEAAVQQAATPQPPGAATPEPAEQHGQEGEHIFHASPSVRALAREQHVDLAFVKGTGPSGRVQKEDILAHVAQKSDKAAPAGASAAQSAGPTSLPEFSGFGPVEELALGRIKKVSGPHLTASWTTVPHVSHFDEADITELEKFRKELNSAVKEGDFSYSPLIFIIKAVAATLMVFPLFNCSLLAGGEKVVLKRYCHLGIAVDTPEGLVVPVLRDADKKGLGEIAKELQRLSNSARAGKLAIPDILGASFTISSLGGIGGTGFTPIVNSPQVAILGLARSAMKPVWDGQQFVPRLILPFSVSYDHRVIDGAEAARFCVALRRNIEDLKRTLI